ncbi:MAG: thermonuclease family protein [Candidatus Omnitrophica bacterium]|nr:thermonuclease family protein [Candidatus Omnitrophota bacterium]
MKKGSPFKSFLISLVILAAIAFLSLFLCKWDKVYRVERVIDGDTILLTNGWRVRYIGIDTPETKHPKKDVEYMGREAMEFNRQLVEGKPIALEFDVEKHDKYDRILAYVRAGDTFVNAELVREGYAKVYTFPPNVKYNKLFLSLQREARKNKRGLWADR